MADSYQDEIPKARVNITLDLETEGAKKKKELPMKLLVAGDFSKGKTKGRVADRERTKITKDNLDSVMAELAPEVNYSVENKLDESGGDLRVKLKIDSMRSLHPEEVANQIPALHKMLAMRNLLKDLKSNLLDNSKLRRELEKVIGSAPELEALKQELSNRVHHQGESNN